MIHEEQDIFVGKTKKSGYPNLYWASDTPLHGWQYRPHSWSSYFPELRAYQISYNYNFANNCYGTILAFDYHVDYRREKLGGIFKRYRLEYSGSILYFDDVRIEKLFSDNKLSASAHIYLFAKCKGRLKSNILNDVSGDQYIIQNNELIKLVDAINEEITFFLGLYFITYREWYSGKVFTKMYFKSLFLHDAKFIKGDPYILLLDKILLDYTSFHLKIGQKTILPFIRFLSDVNQIGVSDEFNHEIICLNTIESEYENFEKGFFECDFEDWGNIKNDVHEGEFQIEHVLDQMIVVPRIARLKINDL